MFLERTINKIILSIVVLFPLLSWSQAMQPERITIGLIPAGSPDVLKKQALDLAKKLQDELNVPIQIYVSKSNYSGLVDAMVQKKVDFAFLSSMTFLQAEKKAGAKVLLKKVWKTPFYFSALVVRSDSNIKKISHLLKKKIAFVDDRSSSGYLYPLMMLKQNDIEKKDFKEVIFTGNHAKSIELLESGKVDAVAVFADDEAGKTGAWTKFSKSPSSASKKFKVLWTSEPIPSDPFVVRQDFYERYPKITHSMMFSLIDIFEKHEKSHKFSEILGDHQLMPATTQQYDPVREVADYFKLD